MAAVVSSVGAARIRLVSDGQLALVARDARFRDGAGPRAGTWRRAVGGLATLVALVGFWFAAGALRATEGSTVAGRADHAVVYVARPGDTLWGIATRLDPQGDPVEVVAALAAELHGAPLRPGAVLTVP